MLKLKNLYKKTTYMCVAGPVRKITCKLCGHSEETVIMATPSVVIFRKHLEEKHTVLNKIIR